MDNLRAIGRLLAIKILANEQIEPDGTKFEGNWQDNLEHGFGMKTYADGAVQKGFWTFGEFVFTEDQLSERMAELTQIDESDE